MKKKEEPMIKLYETFGEFDSFGEINELAENLFNEGDLESIRTLAKENGIPEDFVEMYISGDIPVLCDAMTAAVGKLEVEAQALAVVGLMKDWVEYVKVQCQENQIFAFKVRSKGKSLAGCIGELLKYSFSNQWQVPEELKKAANVSAGRVTFGVPDMAKAKEIISDYYFYT